MGLGYGCHCGREQTDSGTSAMVVESRGNRVGLLWLESGSLLSMQCCKARDPVNVRNSTVEKNTDRAQGLWVGWESIIWVNRGTWGWRKEVI